MQLAIVDVVVPRIFVCRGHELSGVVFHDHVGRMSGGMNVFVCAGLDSGQLLFFRKREILFGQSFPWLRIDLAAPVFYLCISDKTVG